MARLDEIVASVTSKNAGPFWITIDIRCGDPERFATIGQALTTERAAACCGVSPKELKRFDIAPLSVIKFSLRRTSVQGAPTDRDLHGAQHANLFRELEIPGYRGPMR